MAEPLKIGIVCYPTVGGSSVIATEVALHAAVQGHEVHLISYDRPHRLGAEPPDNLHYHAVEVAGYPLLKFPPYDLALATRMLEVHEDAGVRLFHVHYAIPHAVSAFLARAMSGDALRFITTLHGTDITVVGADRAYMRPTRFAIEMSDAVTAVSQFLADETTTQFRTTKPIEVIPNFVDTSRFSAAGTPYYKRQDQERIILHASNFRPVKRVADTVRTFAHIHQEVPSRLVLVGDGPDRDHALAVAADLGCANRIEHVGKQESLETFLAQADLCLMTSETESFGLVLLEAMSCGVPCASTDVGGVREVMGDPGMYAPVGQPKALAEAALPCLREPELHQRLAKAAVERAANFEQSKILTRYFELYHRVLS